MMIILKRRYSTLALLTCMAINMAQASDPTPLDLNAVLHAARQNDPQWLSKIHAYRASKEIKNLASAAIKPSVKLTAQGSREHYDSDTFGSDSYSQHSYGASVLQPLFRADRWYNYKKASFIVKQKEAEFTQAQLDFYMRVVGTYFDVLRANENLRFRLAEKQAIQQQLEQTEHRFAVGLVAEADVQEARAAFDLASVEHILADQSRNQALDALVTLTGSQATDVKPLQKDIPVVAPVPNEFVPWKTLALSHNPTLQAALLNQKAATKDFQAKTAAHLPSVDLYGSYQNNDRYIPTTPGEMTNNSIGIRMELPLYSGGSLSAARRQSRELSLQAGDDVQFVERQIVQNTRTVLSAVNSDVARVTAQQQSIRSATAAYEASKIGYKTGTRTLVDLLTAQQALFRAKRDYANARFDYIFDSLRLKQIAGVLREDDVKQINSWLSAAQ